MNFPLGKPIAAMLLIACGAGMAMWFRPAERHADYSVWVFSEAHARSLTGNDRRNYEPGSPADLFQKETGKTVDVKLVGGRGLDVRLLSMFNDPEKSDELPDVVFIEISNAGKFFRPPVDKIGLLPLNDLLKKSGWYDHMVQSRFAPWMKEDVIFGVPVDLHPLGLTYRKDLFDQAGVDLEAPKTWPEFQEACLKFQDYWKQQGVDVRHAIQLQVSAADNLTVMLLQRGINLIDQHNKLHLTDPKTVETLLFYCQLVAGPRKIGDDAQPGNVGFVRDLTSGVICSVLTPDWSVNLIRSYGPELRGKLRMRPLPVFDPTDAPTSTWGGTCMSIPRGVKDPKAAWKLIEKLWLDPQAQAFHRKYSAIIPPVVDSWKEPGFHNPDPLFGGQKVESKLIELAPRIPPRNVTPFTMYSVGRLGVVVDDIVRRIEAGQTDDLEAYARQKLTEAQNDVERLVNFTLGQQP